MTCCAFPATEAGNDQAALHVTGKHALLFPVVGSLMLLLIYFFFEWIEFFYIIANAVLAGFCFEAWIHPAFHFLATFCLPVATPVVSKKRERERREEKRRERECVCVCVRERMWGWERKPMCM